MEATPEALSINYGGNTYIPYTAASGKCVYINREYMAPFADKREGLAMVIRETESGTPYLVVMFGLLTIGIIMPFDPCSLGPIADHLDSLAAMTRKNAKEREAEE